MSLTGFERGLASSSFDTANTYKKDIKVGQFWIIQINNPTEKINEENPVSIEKTLENWGPDVDAKPCNEWGANDKK